MHTPKIRGAALKIEMGVAWEVGRFLEFYLKIDQYVCSARVWAHLPQDWLVYIIFTILIDILSLGVA